MLTLSQLFPLMYLLSTLRFELYYIKLGCFSLLDFEKTFVLLEKIKYSEFSFSFSLRTLISSSLSKSKGFFLNYFSYKVIFI